MTVRVTPIPAGRAGARYPWECRAHEHDRQAYYHEGHEAPIARWLGDGVELLGYEQGQEVVQDEHLILYGELCDPRRYAELTEQAKREIHERGLTGDAAKEHYAQLLTGALLGRPPREYRSLEDRLADAMAKEPEADAARQADIRREVERTQRSANGSFDITFSPQKSISLYRAGLLAQGREADAAKVEAAHRAGVAAAIEYAQREAGFSRLGFHGRADGDHPSVGRYVDAHKFVVADFLHETSRAGDVQMHAHGQLLNRVPVELEDGTIVWRTLDSRALHKARPGMEAVYHRTMEEQLTRDCPVELETREDGKAREIIGITLEDRQAASTRRQQLSAEVARYVEAYRERTGHEPTPQTLSRMTEQATLHTRQRKDKAEPLDQLVSRWEREAVADDRRTHAEMADAAEAAAVARRLERMGQAVPELDREQVIRTALGEVTSERARFSRDDVMRSIGRALPEHLGEAAADVGGVSALLDSLTDEALTSRYGMVQVTGFELIEAPAELRREFDGRSVYQAGRNSIRYASVEQMTAEERMVAQARAAGPRLSPEQIEAAIASSTLGDDQAAAVRGVLGDGRAVSVIVGPAGAGKSYALGEVTKAWEGAGRKVIGIAPSNIAAAVLNESGVGTTGSIDKFLHHYKGRGSAEDRAKFAIGPDDMIIVDEASMANHPHMSQLMKIVEERGVKLVPVGDEGQMQSVGVGGSFRLLSQELGSYELTTVRRFREADGTIRQWEADASLQLRVGNPECLAAYEEHGRLHGGTEEEMKAAAVRAYLADALSDRMPVLTTPTNEVADELSGRIREALVGFGRVEPDGVEVMGGNLAGRGDLVQTRENNAKLVDSEGLAVINRRLYRVEERHGDGSLTVRHVVGHDAQGREQLGGTVDLPADYVAREVALGYSGTVHATEGRTVNGGGYLYGDGSMSREAGYVALTRSTTNNEAFLVTQREPDDENLRTLDTTPVGLMSRILERETTDRSALETLRDGLEHAESMPALVPIWNDLTGRHVRAESRTVLADALGAEALDRLDAEQAEPLYAALRERQLQGHDIAGLLRDAIGDPRSMSDARELGALLQHRVKEAAARRTPERDQVGPEWHERTPQIPGPLGEFAEQVAEAIQARQETLGRRAAETQPAWAVERLGPVPETEPERAAWEERAGRVEGYREMYGVQAAGTVIGQAPPRGAVEQRAAWNIAYEALGRPDEQRHIAAATDAQLREMVATAEREQAWAPGYVGDQLAQAWQHAREYERQAVLTAAEAATLAGAAERAEAEARAAGLRELADGYREQAQTWEEIHSARQLWQTDTEQVRETAQAAAAELERREVDERQAQAERAREDELWGPSWDREPESEVEREPEAERDVQAPQAERSEPQHQVDAPEPEREAQTEQPDATRDRETQASPEQVEQATEADKTAATGNRRSMQEELRTARAYLERRAQERESAAEREQVNPDAAQQSAEREEQAHRDSARLMRERQAQQELSREIER